MLRATYYVINLYVLDSQNSIRLMLEKLARAQVEMKSESKEMTKNVRHLHYMVNKLKDGARNEELDEESFEDVLSKYIPCETFAELQSLDGKLAEENFFSHAVSNHVFQLNRSYLVSATLVGYGVYKLNIFSLQSRLSHSYKFFKSEIFSFLWFVGV